MKTSKENLPDSIQDFLTFLKFESISTDIAYKPQLLACANWLSDYIKNIGFDVEQWTSADGHPVIFASNLKAGPDKPTLLIYNHYDVQPVDPLDEWTSPPFQPTIRNGEIYARGAQDNKGQCFYVLQALKEFYKNKRPLPINIKLCIEGEEENGSAGLAEILKDKKRQKQLKADYLAIVDMGIPHSTKPAVTLGVRGLVTLEVHVHGSKTDLHSGSHGGIVFNPLHALVDILAKLRDADGKITIPGFYDDVDELKDADKALIALDFNPVEYKSIVGGDPTGGEKKYSPLERAWTRPTLEINGIAGGYSGPGFKTVIPAKAIAKISCRLVPHQSPDAIGHLVAEHIKKLAPKGVEVEVEILKGGNAVRANPKSAVVSAFAKSYEELFNKKCACIFDGGSIPIATQLAEAAQSEVILLGLGLPDDQIHAPDEHFGLDRLEKGKRVIYRAIELLGETQKTKG
jgi:acetylornithine deacetylase/succinyl-diaminopimelate desuccinylase-like protein